MRASFLIKAKEANVITEKGVRAFVMERLLNSPFEKGSVANLDDKTVQVRIEGDEKGIQKFKQQLERDMATKFGNPVISFSNIEQTADKIPTLLKSSHALVVGQLEKGIDVQLKILQSLESMNGEINGELSGLRGAINNMNKELKEELKSIPRELREELKAIPREIREELKALPQELAKVLNKV